MNVEPDHAKLKIERKVVGKGYAHDSARRHVRGEAIYIDDMPDLPGTLHLAPILSPVANGEIQSVNLEAARASEGVVTVLAVGDIPGENEVAPILHGEPIFADGKVEHVGQIIGVVVARTLAQAIQATDKVKLGFDEQTVTLDVETAFAAGEHTHPTQHLVDGDASSALDNAPVRLRGRIEMGDRKSVV